jgi:hypothetical protein
VVWGIVSLLPETGGTELNRASFEIYDQAVESTSVDDEGVDNDGDDNINDGDDNIE